MDSRSRSLRLLLARWLPLWVLAFAAPGASPSRPAVESGLDARGDAHRHRDDLRRGHREAWRPIYRASNGYLRSANRNAVFNGSGDGLLFQHRPEAVTAMRVEDLKRGTPCIGIGAA